MRISNLFEGLSDLKSISGKESPDELKTLYDIMCNVIETNVDPKYIIGWKPAKLFEFLIEAMNTFSDNKKKAKEQSNTIKSFLAEDSLYMQAAYLADEVYSTETSHCRIEGWNICNEFPNIQFNDKTTGLVSRLFERLNAGKKNTYMLLLVQTLNVLRIGRTTYSNCMAGHPNTSKP